MRSLPLATEPLAGDGHEYIRNGAATEIAGRGIRPLKNGLDQVMIPPVTCLVYLSQALAPRATSLNDFEFDGGVPTMPMTTGRE